MHLQESSQSTRNGDGRFRRERSTFAREMEKLPFIDLSFFGSGRERDAVTETTQ